MTTKKTFLFDAPALSGRFSELLKAARVTGDYPVMFDDVGDGAAACYNLDDRIIRLCPTLSRTGRKIYSSFLHEVCHAVAHRAGFQGDFHSRYFGLLVAVVYRRTGMLDCLKLYDFADSEQRMNGKGPLPGADELGDRLAFIVSRSATLARSNDSLEQIAAQLVDEEFAEALHGSPHRLRPAVSFPWGVFVAGMCAGGGLLLAAAWLALRVV